jgi:HlyD family secretion protein
MQALLHLAMATGISSTTVLPPIAGETAPHRSVAASRWIRRLVILMIAAAAAGAVRLAYFQPTPVPVTVARVEMGRVEELVANNKAGTINARRRATLSPETGGRVVRVQVEQGDRVRKGDLLVALSDADVQAQLVLQEQALEAARWAAVESCTAADLTVRDLERARRLAEERLLSRQALDEAESRGATTNAACVAAAARVLQAEAGLDVARASVAETELRAPFAGVVSRVDAELGEWVSPSPPGTFLPSIVELIDTTSIYVRAPFDEADLGKVRTGLPVRITMDAFPARSFTGHVTYVSAYVSEAQQQNRTFDVDAEFDDAAFARTLPPGTSADIEVILHARDNAVRVPTSAILQGGRLLVVRDNTLVSVPVRTGISNWDVTEIVEGLEPGVPVVISLDRAEVHEGARVKVEPEAGVRP